ncbi:MAG TPA: hypothetical protein VEB21_00565, partial [Terriglobales bacterium]|nr:hypothetical protein [Terriglobales bacterium]
VLYLGLSACLRKPIRIGSASFCFPPLRVATSQVLLGTGNFLLVAAALHQLTEGLSADLDFLQLATLLATANAAGILSILPGGIGVMEAVILAAHPKANLFAALVVFRILYFLVPFLIGCTLFVAIEVRDRYGVAERG